MSRKRILIVDDAKVQPAERRKLASLGARGIIAKPFDPMRLAGEVAEIAGW
jgi:CheY-like chemotaxis protein